MPENHERRSTTGLEPFVSGEMIRTALVPLALVSAAMLLVYFLMSYTVSSISLSTLHDTSTSEIRRLASQRASNISSSLSQARELTEFLRSRVSGYFQAPPRRNLGDPLPQLEMNSSGVVHYKNPDRCNMLWSLGRMPNDLERDWIASTSGLDSMMLDLMNVRTDLAAVYFNTAQSYSRYCSPKGGIVIPEGTYDIRDFNFYYLADSENNPGRVPVWTPAYMDPAGLGWVVSCIAPVYMNDSLQAVVGIDITLGRIADSVTAMNLPWDSKAFLTDEDGLPLAMGSDVAALLGVKNNGDESERGYLPLLQSSTPEAARALRQLMGGTRNAAHFQIGESTYFLATGRIHETGWRLFILADQSALLAPVLNAEHQAKVIGVISMAGLALFLVVFLGYLHRRSRRMAQNIAGPIRGLAKASETIASGRYDFRVRTSGISELDDVGEAFNAMASDQQRLMLELRRSNEELEEYNRGLEDIVRQRTQEAEASFRIVEEELEERRKVEKQLQERTLFLHSMMDAVPLPVFYRSRDGVYQGCNRAFEKFFGIKSSELVGREILCVSNEGQARTIQEMESALLSGESGTREHSVQNAEGQWREVIFSSASYTDMVGNAAGMVGVIMDITERKRAEASIRESERNLRKVLQGIGAAIFIIDPNGFKVKDMNELAEELLGEDKKTYVGRGCSDLPFSTEDSKRCGEGMCPLLSGEGKEEEMILMRSDGTNVPVTKTIITAKVNGVIHFFEIVIDITERKDMERQLANAQKLESIGQLAAGIAHEINTPTQYIGDNLWFLRQAFERIQSVLDGYAGLLKTGRDVPEMDEAVTAQDELMKKSKMDFVLKQVPKGIEQSLGGVERVSTIVKAMKNFSHPDSKDRQPVDINAAVENTITVARNEWKYVSEVETDLADDLPPLMCYPSEVNQALLNIIVNAAHAIADVVGDSGEKGTISISTSRDENDVIIRVSDTGTGISKENRDRIFDPFFTTKKVGKGTGQGLSIVYTTIVKNHGGSIDVQSEMGKSTTFVLRLPLQKETDKDE